MRHQPALGAGGGIGHDHRPVGRGGEGRLGRIGELDAGAREGAQHAPARPPSRSAATLFDVGAAAVVDQLEIDARRRRSRGSRSGRSVQPLRASTAALASDGDLFELVRRRLVDQRRTAADERRAAAAGEIVDFALEQLGVGHDDLLAGDRAQPGGLEADPLDGAGGLVVTGSMSPRRNGLSNRIESAANRSEKMPWAARPMAMPPMPRPATSAVTLTPRLSRMTMIAIANKATLTSTRMMAIALPRRLARLVAGRGAITPRISSRAQIAPWSAKAMMKKMSTRRSTRGGTAA